MVTSARQEEEEERRRPQEVIEHEQCARGGRRCDVLITDGVSVRGSTKTRSSATQEAGAPVLCSSLSG